MKWYLSSLIIWLPAIASAEIKGDIDKFDACILEVLEDNTDNPFAAFGAPLICGDAHIPMEQSCGWFAYMRAGSRITCQTTDNAFWAEQIVQLSEEMGPPGSLYEGGMKRCREDVSDGHERTLCELEVNWRTVLEYLSVQAQPK